MATIAKTFVATGASSGLGFEAVKKLLLSQQPYKFIIGARNVPQTQASFDKVGYDGKTHNVSVLPLDLADLKTVKSFAKSALEELGKNKLDVLFLCGGMIKAAKGPGPHGSQWCETYVVNHLSQHYLTHLFREKIAASNSRIVVVSSGGIRGIKSKEDVEALSSRLKADAGTDSWQVYSSSKFIQLLGAHWWRRQLGSSAKVVATSPGLIAGTGLARHLDEVPDMASHPDNLTVEQGGSNLVRAVEIEDLPEDPEQIFLTSWGEWWPKDVYGLSLDKQLQDSWCPSREEIEKEAGIASNL